MKPGSDDLVRVQSESELRAGMTVWHRCQPGVGCTRLHVSILLAKRPRLDFPMGWNCVADVPGHDGLDVGPLIHDGRLYRLKDDAESSEQHRTKQRERVE